MTTLTCILSISILCTIGIFILTWIALAIAKYQFLNDLYRQICNTSSDADSYDPDFSEKILRYVRTKNKGEMK